MKSILEKISLIKEKEPGILTSYFTRKYLALIKEDEITPKIAYILST